MSFADVSSANIVGYANKVASAAASTAKYGVVCPMFNQIATEGMNLSQISVNGYQDDFMVQLSTEAPTTELSKMNNSGKTTSTYRWIDEYIGDAGEGEWTGGHWVNQSTGKVVGTGDGQEDVYMRAGDCYWMHTPDTTEIEVESINLMFNGEVINKSWGFIICEGQVSARYSGIGNMMPTPVGLSQLTVTGYEEDFMTQLSTEAPTMELSTMNNSGKSVVTYRWIDEYIGDAGEGVWAGGYWKNMKSGKAVVAKGQVKDAGSEEEEITLNPGEGLWAHTPDTTEVEIEKLLLIFPKNF